MAREYIRGVRIIREESPPRKPVEHLRYSIDVFDERDNLTEVIGRLAELGPALAAFDAAAAQYPEKRICLREKCRVIRRSSYQTGKV